MTIIVLIVCLSIAFPFQAMETHQALINNSPQEKKEPVNIRAGLEQVHELLAPYRDQALEYWRGTPLHAIEGYLRFYTLIKVIGNQFCECEAQDDSEVYNVEAELQKILDEFNDEVQQKNPSLLGAYERECISKKSIKLEKKVYIYTKEKYKNRIKALQLPGISHKRCILLSGMKEVDKIVKPYQDEIVKACKAEDYLAAADNSFKYCNIIFAIATTFNKITYAAPDDTTSKPKLSKTQTELVLRFNNFEDEVTQKFPHLKEFLVDPINEKKIAEIIQRNENWAFQHHMEEIQQLKLSGTKMIGTR